ncbi:hypothetical protein V8C35DRAFT_288077 [Trichoderma chlorosporum]
MDSNWYFPSFAADATDLYPRPKCHPASVASPPRVVPGRGPRTGPFFSNWRATQEKPLPKVAPPVSVLQAQALPLLLLLYSVHTAGATSAGHAAGFLSSILAHNSQRHNTCKSSASALGPPRM